MMAAAAPDKAYHWIATYNHRRYHCISLYANHQALSCCQHKPTLHLNWSAVVFVQGRTHARNRLIRAPTNLAQKYPHSATSDTLTGGWVRGGACTFACALSSEQQKVNQTIVVVLSCTLPPVNMQGAARQCCVYSTQWHAAVGLMCSQSGQLEKEHGHAQHVHQHKQSSSGEPLSARQDDHTACTCRPRRPCVDVDAACKVKEQHAGATRTWVVLEGLMPCGNPLNHCNKTW